MFYNVGSGSLIKFAHLRLSKPQRLIFELHVYLCLPVTGSIYYYFVFVDVSLLFNVLSVDVIAVYHYLLVENYHLGTFNLFYSLTSCAL